MELIPAFSCPIEPCAGSFACNCGEIDRSWASYVLFRVCGFSRDLVTIVKVEDECE